MKARTWGRRHPPPLFWPGLHRPTWSFAPGHDLRAVDAQDAGEVVGDEVIGALQLALLLRLDGSLGSGVAELILGLYLTLDVVHQVPGGPGSRSARRR